MGNKHAEGSESTLKTTARTSTANESWMEIARDSQTSSINGNRHQLHVHIDSASLAEHSASQPRSDQRLSTCLPEPQLSPAQFRELQSDLHKLRNLWNQTTLNGSEQLRIKGVVPNLELNHVKSATHPEYVDYGAPIDRYLDSIRPDRTRAESNNLSPEMSPNQWHAIKEGLNQMRREWQKTGTDGSHIK